MLLHLYRHPRCEVFGGLICIDLSSAAPALIEELVLKFVVMKMAKWVIYEQES